MVTKEFAEDAIQRFSKSKILDNNMMILMYEYYQEYFTEDKQYIDNYSDFVRLLKLWLSMPIQTERGIYKQTINKGLKNTIKHFKQKFNL